MQLLAELFRVWPGKVGQRILQVSSNLIFPDPAIPQAEVWGNASAFAPRGSSSSLTVPQDEKGREIMKLSLSLKQVLRLQRVPGLVIPARVKGADVFAALFCLFGIPAPTARLEDQGSPKKTFKH